MPRPGDIGLVRIKGPAGWAIQLCELLYDGNWRQSHAFIYLGNDEVIEAEPGGDGVRIANISEYDGRTILWSTREINDIMREMIVTTAREYLHTPYKWRDYFALAAWRFHIRFGFIRRIIEDNSRLICSQYVDLVWEKCGEHIKTDYSIPGYVTPGDLARLAAAGNL